MEVWIIFVKKVISNLFLSIEVYVLQCLSIKSTLIILVKKELYNLLKSKTFETDKDYLYWSRKT